jgi:DHA2 family multidrug resistance protein
MSGWTAEVGVWPIVWTGLVQGIGAGIMLVPIQVIAFPSLPPHQRTEATAVFNLVRSLCSSVGVSIALTLFVVTSSQTRARLVEHVSPYSEALRQATGFDTGTQHGMAVIERQVDLQAAMAGYNADFLFIAIASVTVLPVLLLVGRAWRAKTPPSPDDAVMIAE